MGGSMTELCVGVCRLCRGPRGAGGKKLLFLEWGENAGLALAELH
jgi:hypothetical protein